MCSYPMYMGHVPYDLPDLFRPLPQPLSFRVIYLDEVIVFAVLDDDAWATILVITYLLSVDGKQNLDSRNIVDKANIWLVAKLGNQFEKLSEYSAIASEILLIR